MHLLRGLVICTFVVQRSSCWMWSNDFDERLDFKCPYRHQFISNVVSRHDNDKEDRRFALSCRDVIPGIGDQRATCEHSGYVNNFDGIVNYKCPGNGYINGMESVHNNRDEDRVWAFYCCRMPGISLTTQCMLTDWTNDYDGYQNYLVRDGYAMYGVYSEHSNYYEDRRFRYWICTVGGK